MPHYVLGFCRVIVHVDIRFGDAYPGESSRKARLHYLHPVRPQVTTDIYRTSVRVRPVLAAPLRLLVGRGTVGASQNKRDAGNLPRTVEFVHRALAHVLQRA